ncbi:MAG: HDOD domain-containing protein [Bryobacteraceae bacterium]
MRPATISTPPTRVRTLACLERLPRLSPLMSQLLARLARRNCEVPELTALIEKDPLLAGQVLRMANSAIFGRMQQITTVGHAITMIGVGTLRKFALGNSVANLFSRFRSAPSFSMTRFNLHSVATATLVEALVDELPVEFPEGAFIAGILHDVGRLLIAVTLPDDFESIVSLYAIKNTPLTECERDVLDIDHAELSALAIGRWDLAESIQRAARFHHTPDLALAESDPGPGKVTLSLIINKADEFVNYLGLSIVRPQAMNQKPPSLEFPGFQYSQERALQTFEREWKSVGDLFR